MKTSTFFVAFAGAVMAQNKLKWFGMDESVAEWGSPFTDPSVITWPNQDTIGTLMGEGFNIFRIPFAMEWMTVNKDMTSLEPNYLASLTQLVEYITSSGATAIVDAHNYGRYYDQIITDTNAFQTFWQNLAGNFKDNQNVIFDTNNEYNTMDFSLVFNLNQAAINGIRASGAVNQYIMAEGNEWTSAVGWTQINDGMKGLTDPSNKIIFEMHQYLDDGSGKDETCISGTIGVERVTAATQWLRDNGKIGFLGEFAGGPNDVCKQAVQGLLDYLQQNSDVWQGATFWSAGPSWGNYSYSFEPPSGTAYLYYDELLRTYAPGIGA